MITRKTKSCCSSSETKFHRLNRQYKHNTIKYSNYIKLLDYLSQMCDDKEYHKCMVKLDKFKVVTGE